MAARRVAPAGLDGARRRVRAAHERDRAARCAARGEQLLARPDPGQVDPGARPTLEDEALLAVPLQDRVHGVVDRENEAVVHPQVAREVLAALGLDVEDLHGAEVLDLADVEQHPVRSANVGLHVEQVVAGPQEPGHRELACPEVRRPPDAVVSRRVEHMARRRVHTQHFLDSVGLRRQDPGRPVGVVDLRANRVGLDKAADRDRAGGVLTSAW